MILSPARYWFVGPCPRRANHLRAVDRNGYSLREKLPRYYATYLASPPVMRWVRYRGWRLEGETPEGDLVRVRLRFDVEQEAIQFALSFGGDIEAVEPPELRAKVLAGALAIVKRYRG